MKIALAAPRITRDMESNVRNIEKQIAKAHEGGASFILFPETTLTGLINNDDYEHDIKLAVSIDGDIMLRICNAAKEKGIWVCFGFFENNNGCIHDSAVLINPAGDIVLHQRRISPGWRWPNSQQNPSQYAEGVGLNYAETPFGKTAIAICGDMFDEKVVAMLAENKPDLLLFPFARCFTKDITDAQKEWDEHDLPLYLSQVNRIGALTFMSNYMDKPSVHNYFGGAFVVSAAGEMLAALPLHQEGLLFYAYTN